MFRTTMTFPELGMIAATRVLLGAGIGLLLSNHVRPEHRRPVGWTLFAVGVLTTLPLAATALARRTYEENQLALEESQ